jgi:hypothetical protein
MFRYPLPLPETILQSNAPEYIKDLTPTVWAKGQVASQLKAAA